MEKRCVKSVTRIKKCKQCQLMLKTKASKLQFSVNCGIITNVNGPNLGRPMTQSLNNVFRKAETGKVSSSSSIKRMATKIMIKKSKRTFCQTRHNLGKIHLHREIKQSGHHERGCNGQQTTGGEEQDQQPPEGKKGQLYRDKNGQSYGKASNKKCGPHQR